MSSVLSSAFFFILTLGVLITFHEFGHYWVARRLGVKVLRFSVGFGKSLWVKRHGPDQTEYAVAALPLGGYVKMLDEREGPVASHELHRAFNRQSLGRRAAIVVAGPLFNFFLAVALLWLTYMLGVSGLRAVVGDVHPSSPAAAAGFQAGDEIVAVAGAEARTWNAVILALLDRGLAGGSVPVAVLDASHNPMQRQIDLGGLAASLNQGNLLDVVGFRPAVRKIPPVIGHVEAGSPAACSGLETGDRIVSADGQPIDDWGGWVEYVRARANKPIRMEIDRNGATVALEITPAAREDRGGVHGRIGAAVQEPEQAADDNLIVVLQYGPLAAIGHALVKTWDVTILTLRLLAKMVVGEVSLDNLSGPLSIAQYAGGSASIGLVPFLTFLAIVSVSLGVLNLLPIPVLDGGHLLFYAVEAVKGSPVSPAAEMMGQRIGLVIILIMMVFAFYNDLVRIFG